MENYKTGSKKIDHMMKNWHKYKRTETKEEFFALLNILEANDETLENMKKYQGTTRELFCGIYGSLGDLKDITKVLFDFHIFYKSLEDFEEACKIKYKEDGLNEFYNSFEEYFEEEKEELIKTFGGYVLKLYY